MNAILSLLYIRSLESFSIRGILYLFYLYLYFLFVFFLIFILEKCWTAPELLRLWLKSSECNGSKQQQQQLQAQILNGTQKGDVYSFAIISHEIVLRQGPFYLGEEMDLSPRGIIYDVCQNGLRPHLEEHMADEAVLSMVRRCWHEDPNERPDFVTLQSIIRRINK